MSNCSRGASWLVLATRRQYGTARGALYAAGEVGLDGMEGTLPWRFLLVVWTDASSPLSLISLPYVVNIVMCNILQCNRGDCVFYTFVYPSTFPSMMSHWVPFISFSAFTAPTSVEHRRWRRIRSSLYYHAKFNQPQSPCHSGLSIKSSHSSLFFPLFFDPLCHCAELSSSIWSDNEESLLKWQVTVGVTWRHTLDRKIISLPTTCLYWQLGIMNPVSTTSDLLGWYGFNLGWLWDVSFQPAKKRL